MNGAEVMGAVVRLDLWICEVIRLAPWIALGVVMAVVGAWIEHAARSERPRQRTEAPGHRLTGAETRAQAHAQGTGQRKG